MKHVIYQNAPNYLPTPTQGMIVRISANDYILIRSTTEGGFVLAALTTGTRWDDAVSYCTWEALLGSTTICKNITYIWSSFTDYLKDIK